MNALTDKAHKQGMPHSDMHSITQPHYSTTIPTYQQWHVTVWQFLFVCFVSQFIVKLRQQPYMQDDWKTRWRLHLADPIISFAHQQLEFCMDDERLHTSLEECQDRQKTWLIVKYVISQAALIKTLVFLHFQADLTIDILYNSICVDRSLQNCRNVPVKRHLSKVFFAAHAKLFIFSVSLVD